MWCCFNVHRTFEIVVLLFLLLLLQMSTVFSFLFYFSSTISLFIYTLFLFHSAFIIWSFVPRTLTLLYVLFVFMPIDLFENWSKLHICFVESMEMWWLSSIKKTRNADEVSKIWYHSETLEILCWLMEFYTLPQIQLDWSHIVGLVWLARFPYSFIHSVNIDD